jgi:hypothetical protein
MFLIESLQFILYYRNIAEPISGSFLILDIFVIDISDHTEI